jgi:hypothetical protein
VKPVTRTPRPLLLPEIGLQTKLLTAAAAKHGVILAAWDPAETVPKERTLAEMRRMVRANQKRERKRARNLQLAQPAAAELEDEIA